MQASGGTIPIQSSRACIVYDAQSGKIYHVHEVITLQGGREPTEAQIEAHAMAIVKRKGYPEERLSILHMPLEELPRRRAYIVDLKTKALVPKPPVGALPYYPGPSS